ncbi:TetR family transcriptional regulator [Herbihabitans rhizosphaerae]|uniref:TetR family transcriptional regulator n=1 Tax=Herbihabitans rhizosphaerae TaxID=1872711 RepID=A0A4Q7KX92_9PSEU|nr:TetR family transcriptional regulator [Herbihabitans rhizosphaerae]RZS41337.1 TetR family transcriptional regulator [Herbihabitans rhizosphaerae]
MTSSPSDHVGLRERKKAKTRAALREHAMRLFEEQGYAATTVEQIAEAAEVSPSTFFRYFPTKEEVVLADDVDPIAFAAFQAQPAELSPLQALRATITDVFGAMSEDVWEWERRRQVLIASVPELRAAMALRLFDLAEELAEQVAERVGRDAGDFEVRNFAGVIMGMSLGLMSSKGLPAGQPDYRVFVDRALAHLEEGLPL